MKQEQIIQIQLIEQEVNQLNEQLKLIELNVQEMNELKLSLDEIEDLDKNNSKNKEILANLGRRIYLPVFIKDGKLIVDVGKNNFVKKSISETKKIINEQLDRLNDAKYQLIERLNELQTIMDNLIGEIEEEQSKSGYKEK